MAARQLALDQSKKVCGNFFRGEPDHFGFLGGREQDFLVSQEQAVALVTTFTYLNTDGSVYMFSCSHTLKIKALFSHNKEERKRKATESRNIARKKKRRGKIVKAWKTRKKMGKSF